MPITETTSPATDPGSVPPRTLRIASIGAALFGFLLLLELVLGLTEQAGDAFSTPRVVLTLVTLFAMFYSWIQALVLLTRDHHLLKRHRTNWIWAVALGGPFAGTAFVFWYARRTAD